MGRCSKPGLPNPRARDQPVRNQAAQQEVSGGRQSEASSAAPHRSHYHLNHAPAPVPVHGKIIFHETGPWCQNVGERCSKPSQRTLNAALEVTHMGNDSSLSPK